MPGDRVGRFQVRREVGRGGFGAVYEALDTELNRIVALKTLRLSRPASDPSAGWMKKEAEAVARLDHLSRHATLCRIFTPMEPSCARTRTGERSSYQLCPTSLGTERPHLHSRKRCVGHM